MKKAIVTGATSMIGIALLRLLEQRGYEPLAVVRPASLRKSLLKVLFPKLTIMECELRETGQLNLPGSRYDILFHLGWSSDFYDSRYNSDGQRQNIKYCNSAAELAARYGCKAYLCVGSQAECGVVYKPITPYTEENPMTAYAEAKCAAYTTTKEFCRQNGIKHYWPRLLSAYGPYDRNTTMIMSCIRNCRERRMMELTPAEQIWDYVYVDDAARAILAIAEKGNPEKKYPVASGVGRVLKDYIVDIADIMGYPKILDGIGKREYTKDQVMYLVGDIDELCRDTGISIEYSFRQGLTETARCLF